MFLRISVVSVLLASALACSEKDHGRASLRLALSSSTIEIKPGGTGSVEVTLLDEDQTEDVELVLEGLPAGVTSAPVFVSAFAPKTVLRAWASPTVSVGTSRIRLIARSSGSVVGGLAVDLVINDPGKPATEFGTDGRVTIESTDDVLTVWSPSFDRAVLVAGGDTSGLYVVAIGADGELVPSVDLPIRRAFASASADRLYVGGLAVGCREDCARVFSIGPDGSLDERWASNGEVEGVDGVEEILDISALDRGVRILAEGGGKQALVDLDGLGNVTRSAWSDGRLGGSKVGLVYEIVGDGVVAHATESEVRIVTWLLRFDRNLGIEKRFAGGSVAVGDVAYQRIVPAADGGFYACGFAYGPSDSRPHPIVDRWRPDGEPDSVFGLGGTAHLEVDAELAGTCSDLVVAGGGLVARSGAAFRQSSWLGKLRADGTLDREFGDDGSLYFPAVSEFRSLTRGAGGEIVFGFRDDAGIQIQKLQF